MDTPDGPEDSPLQTLSSREVYRNRWMTVREDAIRRQDGSEGLHGVVSKPDFALVIPHEVGGFFLVEQSDQGVHAFLAEQLTAGAHQLSPARMPLPARGATE